MVARKNECPGAHWNMIANEDREDCGYQMSQRVLGKRKNGDQDSVLRTELSKSRIREVTDLLVLPRKAGSLQNCPGFSRKT